MPVAYAYSGGVWTRTSTGEVANVTRVVYTTSWPARPAGANYVEWVGPSTTGIVGMISGDTFVSTAG